ncbi:envelope stress sensor histidine kinase CpxA [Vibrio sp. RC27]
MTIMSRLNSLNGRIFAIFWLTICIVLVSAIYFTHLDPRKSRPLAQHKIERLESIKYRLEERFKGENLSTITDQLNLSLQKRHNNDERPKDKDRPRVVLYLANEHGQIINSVDNNDFKLRFIRNFITSIDDVNHPQERQYGKYQITGPVKLNLAGQPLTLYSSARGNEPSVLLIGLFDHPISLFLTMMLVSTPFLLWLSWALSQPAKRLASAAQRVAQGEFQVDEKLEQGPNEFRQAGRSFNQMVEAVNGMISGQQRLLSDISHELRSPLTRLRMANGLAKRKTGESSELERIDTEAQRLEQMIGELLELSRMQVNSHSVREEQPLGSLWQEMLEDAEFEAEQRNKKLSFSPVPDRIISGTPKLLMSAVENIVRNAIYYGKDQIVVNLEAKENTIQISVDDNGEGVPETELDQIFRPFYRVSTARDRHSGGTGLGLTITESAVRQHSGTITANRSHLGGLKVTMTLPIKPE